MKVDSRGVCGTGVAGRAARAQSWVSKALHPAFLEPHKGTDRNRNAGTGRKS